MSEVKVDPQGSDVVEETVVEKTAAGAAETAAPQERSGAAAIVEALKASGVDLVIGYSGGGTGAVIHEVATAPIKNLNARTELGGAWIAYGYNRIKRRAAAANIFHSVGMLHTAPAVYAAKLDSVPMLVMDVNLDSHLDLREGLQDSTANYLAMQPLAKYIRKIPVPTDLPLAIRQAVLSASTGRPGPSVLDLPFQVLVQPTDTVVEELELPAPPGTDEATLDRMLDTLMGAKQPVILVGAGTQLANAYDEVAELAELLGIGVASTSWGGRGTVPDDHPLFAGVVGSFGWDTANEFVQRSDCWLAVGTTFSQMTTGAWNIEKPDQVIHVDIDPNQLGKIFQPSQGVVGDARVVLRQLIDRAKARQASRPAAPELLQRLADGRAEWEAYHDSLAAEGGSPINQYYLIKKMSETLPDDTIVVADSGGQAFMLYRSFHYKQATPMAAGSRYMSLGASLPMAIGAKLAAPERTVVSYHGDGGFYYDFAELSTLSSQGIKVIVILDNNGCLYANRQGMKLWGIENPWVDLPDTDFVGLAKALGVEGERVTDSADVESALQRAVAAEGSYLIDVVTDPETRIKRAIKDVIPIVTDRKPQQGADAHFAPPLLGSWPN
jgi:acetolactate synthase I/II/III large subunit